MSGSRTTIAAQCSRFEELFGSALEWQTFITPHSTLYLKVSAASRRRGIIHFHGVRYVDGPLKLQKVRLRLATEAEWETVRLQLLPEDTRYLRSDKCLVIEGDGGRALIVAETMLLNWEDDGTPVLRQVQQQESARSDAPLWEGGPPLSRL